MIITGLSPNNLSELISKIDRILLPMSSEIHIPRVKSTHAILTLNGDYILQLRDNRPDISASGKWSLFGGMIRNDETPLQTIKREIWEELLISAPEYLFLWTMDHFSTLHSKMARTWFFQVNVDDVWSQHRLLEGKDVRAFRYDQTLDLDMIEVMRAALKRFYLEK